MSDIDEFQHWRDALNGKDVSVEVENPQSGFYKMRAHKGGPWIPVAIWRKDGVLKCRVLDVMRDPVETWIRCAKNPVTKQDAKHAFENDGAWPGDIESIAEDIPDAKGDTDAKSELTQIIKQANEWGKNPPDPKSISKDVADQAANFDDRVIKLEKLAREQRSDEIKPLQDEIDRIEKLRTKLRSLKEDWKSLLDDVPTARGILKTVYVGWQREQSLAGKDTKCGGQHANRKSYIAKNDALHPDTIAARKAAEEKERQRQEAERRAQAEIEREAEAQRQKAVLEEAERIKREQEAKPAPAPEPPKTEPVQPVATITQHSITDMQATMAWALEQQDVINWIESYAIAEARKGVEVPGVTQEEVERAA